LKDEIEKANLYSDKWFENATDAELEIVSLAPWNL